MAGRGIYLEKAKQFHAQAAGGYGAMQQQRKQTTKTKGGGSSGIGSVLGPVMGIAGTVAGAYLGGGGSIGSIIGKMFSGGSTTPTSMVGNEPLMASNNYDAQQNSLGTGEGSFSDYAPGYFM